MQKIDKKQSFSKKIISLLSSKSAVSVPELEDAIKDMGGAKYTLKRSLKGLEDTGMVETHYSGQNTYTRLTREGKRKAHSIKLEHTNALFNPNWDGKWRIIILDLPEDRKSERDGLRYLLKKAGFVLLKNSVWISHLPLEHLFMNIKTDLGLSTELIIIVTDTIDKESEKTFLNHLM